MIDDFEERNRRSIEKMTSDDGLQASSQDWFNRSISHEYSYHFKWMGIPIIQYPQDMVAMQEIIWNIKPDLIIETGIARGGSLVFYASLLELLGGDGLVVGIDIDIRPHNRAAIEQHRMGKRIHMIEGSSVVDDIIAQVAELAHSKQRVLVALDSNHTHQHVLEELRLYSPFVTRGSYLIVFDTVVEQLPSDAIQDRPWSQGNNPLTAVHEFLESNKRFEVDHTIHEKLLLTVAPYGYLKCIAE